MNFLKNLLPLLIIGILMVGCRDDDPNLGDIDDEDSTYSPSNPGTDKDWAPTSMVGRIISWSESNSDGTAGNYDVRVKFNNSTDMSTNFSDWCTYTYKRLSSTKAHLNFMAPQRAGSVVRTFQYDFDLIFISSKEFSVSGSLTVNYLSGPNVGSTFYTRFTGKGHYVNDLW